jgi:peptidyl-dipeptidase A
LARYGDAFYTSLGLEALPTTFYERSQFIRPRDRDVDCHASAWDIDANQDLRIKMCIHIDADNFTTVHHEEGHNEYMRAYRNLPFLFRNGANDGFHEAIGDSVALSITPEYLRQLHLIDTIPPPEADIPIQLRTALDKVAFLPFGLLIDKWRWQVFSGQVKPEDYNKAWWALREEYQGVAPPVARTEADFDPGAKNHIPANVPYARYYLAAIYQFQFYKAMCEAAGYKGPLNRCSFFGSKAAGAKLAAMLKAGASQPWQITLKEMTGVDHLDAGPMLEYFQPLYLWLKQQNALNRSKPGWQISRRPSSREIVRRTRRPPVGVPKTPSCASGSQVEPPHSLTCGGLAKSSAMTRQPLGAETTLPATLSLLSGWRDSSRMVAYPSVANP